ncbi:Vomeronasal type-1 receptor 90 [Microtus ochrogaster]|uniref:Vomeronasal type-1 receptor n=1 Tax=Microtus ochrogaster TaxID=79684 RepID=A0A8J6KMF5_MICOH|nr:Vomeronasal type-1 receptor 90 [Microtus ochrogaster]
MSSLMIVFNFQAGLGVLANMFLLVFYTFIILGHRPKPMDMMLCHQTFIHIVLLITGTNDWFWDISQSLNMDKDFQYYIIKALILTTAFCRDVFLVGLMLATSAYMVIILFRHQRQHKHLHSLSHLRASPESRATHTILLLVDSFVVMYWVDFIISSTAVLLRMYNPVILSVQKFVMNVYPTITPLIQISSDNRIINMLKHMQSMCHQIFKKR